MRYRGLVGLGLTLGALLAGAGAVHFLPGHVPLQPAALACLGAGVILLGGDLSIRRFSGAAGFWSRYFGSQASWSVRRVLPLWVLGLTLLTAALSFPTP
ncbi:MAG: hypothetical protein K0R38_4800 [Polyangiaceae bacterium]|nr:hypothetical protein [Polyangiaceae bacterium]